MNILTTILLWSFFPLYIAFSFSRKDMNVPQTLPEKQHYLRRTSLRSQVQSNDNSLQFLLFKEHHAKGRWQGSWNTYDYIGNMIDSTQACVTLNLDSATDQVQHTHEIVVSSTSSDCNTCFDSSEVKTLPIATYSSAQDLMKRRIRCAYSAMVIGPNPLRSVPGAISTEIVLPTTIEDKALRTRIIFQHAPVWQQGVQPGSCPPQGLKLYRMILCREVLTEHSQWGNTHPYFAQNIPPYEWHKQWAGTSWTWGPTLGDRGWNIEALEEFDAWHGRPMGDTDNVWSLRLPGGILVTCPRVITGDEAGLFRCAWLLLDDSQKKDSQRLQRVEASVFALQPLLHPDTNDLIGFQPPSLGSLRCDLLRCVGELENTSKLDELMTL